MYKRQVFRENFDCQFISRGEQLEILGEAAEVKMAATLVEELQYLYRQGTTITMHEAVSYTHLPGSKDQQLFEAGVRYYK